MNVGEKIGWGVLVLILALGAGLIARSVDRSQRQTQVQEAGAVYLLRSQFTPGSTNLNEIKYPTITHTFGVRGTNGQIYEFMNLRNHIVP